jgi:hypothetical protein
MWAYHNRKGITTIITITAFITMSTSPADVAMGMIIRIEGNPMIR